MRPTGRSSARAPTRTSAESFALAGPSNPPDPACHAYRKDLADVALAGRVIASHYAKPVERVIATAASLRSAASQDAEALCQLGPGEPFRLLEESRGWAWGYGGAEGRVGYVPSEAIARD